MYLQVKEFWRRRTLEAIFIGVCTNLWCLYLEAMALTMNFSREFVILQTYYIVNSILSGVLMVLGLAGDRYRGNTVFVAYVMIII